jgi:hypothetical protein
VFYGLDFGGNVWGSHVGVSTRRSAIQRDFTEMASLGLTVVRWFVFCDGRSGIVYDEAGLPWGLDRHVFADLDTALEIAQGVGVALLLVLLDHRWMFRGLRDVIPDPATGVLLEVTLPEGRANALIDQTGQDRLFRQVFVPIVRRYAPTGVRADLSSAVFAYELMNEPDFVIEEWEEDLSREVVRPIRFDVLAAQVARLSDLVHSCSSARTTLAAARLRNLWAWDDGALDLDFLQVHSYPDLLRPLGDEDIYGRPAASLGCSRPIVLGEFPGNGPVQHPAWSSPPPWTLGDYLEFGLDGGYGGAWPWSFSGTDGHGRFSEGALRKFCHDHPELVNPRGASNGMDSIDRT